MFIDPAFAQGAPAAGPDPFTGLLIPMLLMVLIFYFLVIRPQSQRAAQHKELVASFLAEVARRWDLPALDARVLDSQRRRRLVYESLTRGRLTSWDHQPMVDASQQYMRNHIDLDDLERRARFPAP